MDPVNFPWLHNFRIFLPSRRRSPWLVVAPGRLCRSGYAWTGSGASQGTLALSVGISSCNAIRLM